MTTSLFECHIIVPIFTLFVTAVSYEVLLSLMCAIMINATGMLRYTVLHCLFQMLKAGVHVNDRDGLTDMTMLHYACKSGARGIGCADESCCLVKKLLSHGADPYIRCRWTNMTALHYATYFDVAPVVAILLESTKGIGLCRVVEYRKVSRIVR